jgi:transcriptional regulator with XRE-family HTH domain
VARSTDADLLARLGRRLAAERLRQNRTQAELATEAGVSLPTIKRLELGSSVQLTNLIRVLRALGRLDDLSALVPDTERLSPREELGLTRTRRRRRATPKTKRAPQRPTDWKWGDES